MSITRNFSVEFIINDTTFTDISDFVVSLDDFVLQSTGKISTAKLTLNSEFGNFITDANGGNTPLLTQFDRIRIGIIGDDGVTTQFKIFEITTDLSQNMGRSSYLLPLELEGRERNLSGVPFGGFFRTATHAEIIEDIQFAYNGQRGTLQPLIDTVSDIPDFNPNIWDFTQVDNCYDALLEVLASLNLPVSAGGGGNRYALIFEDVYNTFPTDIALGLLEFKVIIQGTNSAPVTLAQNDAHPITKIDRIKMPSTGSVTIARGRPKTSQQPQNYPLFLSKLEFYRNIKGYENSIDYPTGSHVSLGANVGGWPQRYIAIADTTAGDAPPSASWTAIDVGDFVGNIQYSPFTIDKAGPWRNGFAHPNGVFNPDTLGAISIPDHNLVINDVLGVGDAKIGTYRNFVTFRTNSPFGADQTADNKNYMFDIAGDGINFGWFEGFTILVDPNIGALQGIFTGNDPNGLPYSNNMAVFRPFRPQSAISIANAGTIGPGLAGGDFFVVREVEDFDQTAVYAEALVYEWNVPFTPSNRIYPGGDRRRGGSAVSVDFQWRSIADSFMGNECFHTPISVSNVTGLVPDDLSDGEPLNNASAVPYNQDSGIQIVFGYNQADETPIERDVWFDMFTTIRSGDGLQNLITALAGAVFTTFSTPNYTNMGWWFAWPSPFPFSTFNGIAEEVGELYGGGVGTLNRHRYFDLFNIQHTTTGLEGWTHPDSTDLSEITGVEFLFQYDITISGTRVGFTGDVPFSYWCIDKFGTLWKSPKIMYRHLGETQQIKIEFGDLSPVFRGRTPLGVDNVLENIIVGEVEVNEEFFKDNIIMQGFQCETPYDEFGRYSPNLWEQIIKPIFFDVFGGGAGTVNFTGIIDAYGFTKTPVAISASTVLSGERTIIPQFEDYQNITNIEQLQRFADSSNQVNEFQYQQYTVKQGGINDLNLEDPVVLTDPYMINDADSGPNTILLATRELHYSVPAGEGLIRKVVLVKVIDT